MTTTTLLPQPVETTTVPAVPLTAEQQDALILLAASTEKPARVKRRQFREQPGMNRAWSTNGLVD